MPPKQMTSSRHPKNKDDSKGFARSLGKSLISMWESSLMHAQKVWRDGLGIQTIEIDMDCRS